MFLARCLLQRPRKVAGDEKALLNCRGEQAAGRPRVRKGRGGTQQRLGQPVHGRGRAGHRSVELASMMQSNRHRRSAA
jgi:hypothetical protein